MALLGRGFSSSIFKFMHSKGPMRALSKSFSRPYRREELDTPQNRPLRSHRALHTSVTTRSAALALMAECPHPEPSATPDIYEYASFTDSYSIRILTLAPGAGDGPLAGYLTAENLDFNPEYEAVSYVWGAGDRCSQIQLNDRILPLTQSIHGALQRMRHPTRARRLWADQICINQGDIAERSQQVGLMNAIYKGANHILVWLGPDEENVGQDALDHLHHLKEIFNDELSHEAFRTAHSEELLRQRKELWAPLSKLTKLPWFNRIWIVQEIGTAAKSTLYWGETEIDWEVLSSVALVLNRRYHYLRTQFGILTPNIRYLYRRFVEPEGDYTINNNRGNFIYELHGARHLRAKDPRDHIYAFLGHFAINAAGQTLQNIKADYSKSVEDVYFEVAAGELSEARSLILLNSCQALPANHKSKSEGPSLLPSWVPDWRLLPLHLIGSPESPHRAAGGTSPKVLIDQVHRALHAQGVRVDTVSNCSQTLYGRSFQFRNDRSLRLPIEVLWQDTCGYKTFTLDEPYINGDFAFYALVQTLTNACINFDRSRQYDTVSKMEWLSSGAAYLVRAEGGSDLISPEIQELAQGGDAFKWSHEATLVTRYRKFAITGKGYYVIGPDAMQQGDQIVVLFGGKTPYVVRREKGQWLLLGECYVHGLMNGEALEEKGLKEEVFTII